MAEEGDVVEMDYVGRVRDSGEIFDLTSEELAEEEGYDSEDLELGPVKVLVGAGHVIPGLEKALEDMEEGDDRTVEVDAEDAFGERSGDNIETFSHSEFDDYDVEPRRGLVIEVDGRRGKIVSSSSGRVRVDFNHPLSGKDLEYDLEILSVLGDVESRVEAVLEYYGLDEMNPEFEVEEGTLELELPENVNPELASHLEEELSLVKGVESVEIV